MQVAAPQAADAAAPFVAFAWDAPDDVRIVTCALFGCSPEVEEISDQGAPRYRIVNYDQCVIARADSPSNAGTFDPANQELLYRALGTCDSATPNVTFRRDIGLAVGCWAYDSDRIVAATELKEVAPDEVFHPARYEPHSVAADCSYAWDGQSCKHPHTRSFGTCYQGDCRSRCRSEEDCVETAYLDLAGSHPSSPNEVPQVRDELRHRWDCRPLSSDAPLDRFVGLCVPEEKGGDVP